MLKEFKEFALRGNVVDMSVGIIIGAAFTTIVRSMVDDIIMPPIGVVTGGVDFSNMSWCSMVSITTRWRKRGRPVRRPSISGVHQQRDQLMIVAFVLFMAIKGRISCAASGGGAGHRAASVPRRCNAPTDPRCLGGGRFGPETGAGPALAGPRPSKDFAPGDPAAAASLRAWGFTQNFLLSELCGNDFAIFYRLPLLAKRFSHIRGSVHNQAGENDAGGRAFTDVSCWRSPVACFAVFQLGRPS